MKLTKIVATIGPSCDSPEIIEKMIREGVNVFRFNFKHASLQWHEERIKRVNEIAAKLNIHVGTLLDLQGPEIRVNLPFDKIEVRQGNVYPFGERIFRENIAGISITYPHLINSLKGMEKVLIDDGYLEFEVVKKGNDYFLLSKQDGIVYNRKNFNILEIDLPFESILERDLEGLKMAVKNEVDFIAISFVRSAKDILILKKEMKKINLKAKIIAKIETKNAIKNIDIIIEQSDGIMIARGDLGIQMPIEKVPYYQKLLIEKAHQNNKFVITATQMLQTMITSKIPTRAEVSDVANACYDGTDALMLSGETANGKYPVEAVAMMRKIIDFNEKKSFHESNKRDFILTDKEEIIAKMTVDLLRLQKTIDAIVVFTETGKTARLLSVNQPFLPIIALVPDKKVADSLTVNYGIYPFVYKDNWRQEINLQSVKKAIFYFKKTNQLKFAKNDFLVLHGDYWRVKGGVSTLRFFKFIDKK